MFTNPRKHPFRCHRVWMTGLSLCLTWSMTTPPTTLSSGFKSPEECLAYDDAAHLNCLYAYIEIQQEKISQLEAKLNQEKRTSQQLQDNVNHQLSLNEVLQQRISDREHDLEAYRYPPIGLYSGLLYDFGRPRYYRRFFQPQLGFHFGPYYPYW